MLILRGFCDIPACITHPQSGPKRPRREAASRDSENCQKERFQGLSQTENKSARSRLDQLHEALERLRNAVGLVAACLRKVRSATSRPAD